MFTVTKVSMEEMNVDPLEGRLDVTTKDEDYESGGDSAYATIQVDLCRFGSRILQSVRQLANFDSITLY